MTDNGWIKLHRKLLDSNMYQQLNTKQRDVMLQCLLLANHEEKQWEWKGKIFTAKPGQFITSLERLKEKCASDVSFQNIRTALLKLEKWKFITNESTKTGRLVTLVNWELYQSNNERLTNKPTKNQQTANKQLTTNKNDKELKEYSLASIEARKLSFKSTLEPFLDTYNRSILNEFYLYWTELNKSKTKMRFELERTWETEKRIRTWDKRASNFNTKNEFKTKKLPVKI